MSSISLLFGIGNPGARYRHTRHNIGVDTLASLAERHTLSWVDSHATMRRSRWRYSGRDICIVQSLTYMNVSGEALEACGGIEPDCLIVVCDDVNLPLGRLRIRPGGGSGGHRGLESIINTLATVEFPRLRMGIGGAEDEDDLSDYVLAPFGEEERPVVTGMMHSAVEALETIVGEGLEAAMQRYNRKDASST